MRWVPRTPAELEQSIERDTGMYRTAGKSVTRADVERLTRKRLGPSWGRKRRRRTWP